MPEITLIAKEQARPGFVFTFMGAAPVCRTCPYRQACLTLDTGRRYEIVGVRPVSHPCALQETEARVVEVAARPRTLLVDGPAAVAGATVEVGRTECSRLDCPNWDDCAGPSLGPKARYRVVSAETERTTCLIGRNLKRVEGV